MRLTYLTISRSNLRRMIAQVSLKDCVCLKESIYFLKLDVLFAVVNLLSNSAFIQRAIIHGIRYVFWSENKRIGL